MSRRSLYILSGFGVVALGVVFWFLLLSPVMKDIDETEAQIATEQQAVATAQTKLAQLEEFRIQSRKNESRLLELAKMVPLEDEVPSLILQVEDLAAEAGIDFLTINPATQTTALAPGATTAGFEVVTLAVKMKGRFFDINDFVYRAEQLAAGPGRLLRIERVKLTPEAGGKVNVSPKLAAEMTINAYTRVPSQAPPASAPVTAQPVAQPGQPGAPQANASNTAG
jgi:Tfp pilus assembly protein PilO